MAEAGAYVVLSQQGKSRLQAEDMLIIKCVVTFCAISQQLLLPVYPED